MKKRIIAIIITTILIATPTMAQIFLTEEEEWDNIRAGESNSQLLVNNPAVYDSGLDWYAPLGEGILMLAGMAGAYLFGKRIRKE